MREVCRYCGNEVEKRRDWKGWRHVAVIDEDCLGHAQPADGVAWIDEDE